MNSPPGKETWREERPPEHRIRGCRFLLEDCGAKARAKACVSCLLRTDDCCIYGFWFRCFLNTRNTQQTLTPVSADNSRRRAA